MKIYLIDRKIKMVDYWKIYFGDLNNVEMAVSDLSDFLDRTDVECIVSPGNSYGLMDGGLDLAIAEYFGSKLPEAVQSNILRKFRGEQPVATSIIVNIPGSEKKLIYTPTMRVPSPIREPLVIYQCMRTALITALDAGVKSIVIPAFGGRCGELRLQQIAELMRAGYDQIFNPPINLDWDYAESRLLEHRFRR